MVNRKTVSVLVSLGTVVIAVACLAIAKAAPKSRRDVRARNTALSRPFISVKEVPGEGSGVTSYESPAAFYRAAKASADRQRARFEERRDKWRGTEVLPATDAAGAARDVQEKIAALLAKQDRVPERRKAHFRAFDTPTFGLRGWTGVLKDVSPSPDGLLVTVDMRPTLVTEGTDLVHTPDYVRETYLYANNQLTLVDVSEPTGTRLSGVYSID